jgi:hypothetical protein
MLRNEASAGRRLQSSQILRYAQNDKKGLYITIGVWAAIP